MKSQQIRIELATGPALPQPLEGQKASPDLETDWSKAPPSGAMQPRLAEETSPMGLNEMSALELDAMASRQDTGRKPEPAFPPKSDNVRVVEMEIEETETDWSHGGPTESRQSASLPPPEVHVEAETVDFCR